MKNSIGDPLERLSAALGIPVSAFFDAAATRPVGSLADQVQTAAQLFAAIPNQSQRDLVLELLRALASKDRH